jgi:NADH:ubiquinone oxidoreductase subunit
MFRIEMKWWIFETLLLWLHHKVDPPKKDATTQMKKWMFNYIKKVNQNIMLQFKQKNECLIVLKSRPKQNV